MISFASVIVLARLLSPEDFGLLAMLAPSVGLIGLFQDLGLHQTIIQRQRLTHGQKSGLFWISLSASALLATVLVFTAQLQANFYNESRLFNLTVAFSILVVIWSIQSIHMALLTRSMQFRTMAIIDVTATTFGFLVGAATAYATGSYWAIYIAMLVTGLTAAVMSWSASGFWPRRSTFEGEMTSMIAFGSSVSVSQFFDWMLQITTRIENATVLVFTAQLQANFYNESRLFNLTVAFSILVVIWSIQSIHMALLTRSMQFRTMAIIDVTATTFGFLVGAATAYATGSYWAIYIAMLVTGLTAAVMSWSASGFWPRRSTFEGEMTSMIAFGSSVSVSQFFDFVARNADTLLIGRFHGSAELGLYERAYKLLLFPLQQVTTPIGRVMIPFLSRPQNEPGRYRYGYITCISGIMILTQPAILFAVIYSEDLLQTLLGSRWLDAAPIFSWLGLAGLHQVVTATLGWLLISQARSRDLLITAVIGCAITVASFVVGLPGGALGVARAYVIADLSIKMPFLWWVITRSGPVSLGDLFDAVWPHGLAIATAGSSLVFAKSLIVGGSPLVLIVLFTSSYVIYVATLMCIGSKSKLIVSEVSKRLNALRGPRST